MRRPSPKQFFQELASEIFLVSWALYKIMIPTLIVVKALEEMGALVYLSWLLSPLMSLVGLPESACADNVSPPVRSSDTAPAISLPAVRSIRWLYPLPSGSAT